MNFKNFLFRICFFKLTFLWFVILNAACITWFIMNNFWKREFDAHEVTKADRDILMEELKVSENERLTDVITGIPNARSLQNDIDENFSIRAKKRCSLY